MKKTALILAIMLIITMIPCIGIVAESTVDMTFTIDSNIYTINGETKTMDVAPIIIDGRTLMPVRAVAEGLGATVSWDEMLQLVTIDRYDVTLRMTIGGTAARVHTQEVTLDVAPVIIEDRTYMPIRFVAENLYADVSWTETTRTVGIRYDGMQKPVMNTFLVEDETDVYAAKVYVPVFQGIDNLAFQIDLNAELRSQLVSSANSWMLDFASGDPFSGASEGIKMVYETSCTLKYNKHGFLSVTVYVYSYEGGAHPNSHVVTYNIDTNKPVSNVFSSTLFSDASKDILLDKINVLAQNSTARDEIGTVEWVDSYYLFEDNFVAIYSPYEIASYAQGFIEFVIPLAELADIINPDYAYLTK